MGRVYLVKHSLGVCRILLTLNKYALGLSVHGNVPKEIFRLETDCGLELDHKTYYH